MPNTLVHLGVQAVATRTVVLDPDIKWIALGCLIPDLPWIWQRVLQAVAPGLNPYDLRLYAIVQASFAGSLLLCGAFAAISEKPRLVFSVLALNSFLHLLLDACETKWGNGVHLVAPFSWDLVNFGLFWPESLLIYLLTAFGVVYTVGRLRHAEVGPVGLSFGSPKGILLALALLGAYYSVPLALLHGPQERDNHSIKTLREKADRGGREVALDRSLYLKRASGDVVRTFAREELRTVGKVATTTGHVSIRGRFIDADTILVRDLHYNNARLRDWANYIGLLLVAVIWVRSLLGRDRDRAFKNFSPTSGGSAPQGENQAMNGEK
jgi:hypothetical protein